MRLLPLLLIFTTSAAFGATPNLLTNAGFESGLSPWQAQAGGTVSPSTTSPHAGVQCGRSTNRTATNQGLRQSVMSVAAPARGHIGSAWVRTSSSTPVTVSMVMNQNDARGNRFTTMKTAQVADQWTRIEGYYLYDSNGTLTTMNLYFAGPPAGVDLFIDEASFSVFDTVAPENLLANADLEGGSTPWRVHGPGTVTVSASSAAHTGGGALLAGNRTATWHGAEQSLMGKMEEGRHYYAAGWITTDSATAATVRLTMEVVDSGGSRFFPIAVGTASSATWTWLTGFFEMPASTGLTDVRFFIEGPPAGVSMRGDDFYLAPLTGLRRAAAAFPGLKLGAALAFSQFALEEKTRSAMSAHFHLASTTNALKFSNTEPADGIWTFAEANEAIALGLARGGATRGHAMLWHNGLPAWVSGGTFTETQLQTMLWDQIDTKGAYYRHILPYWDVANEVIADSGGTLKSTLWYDTPGIGYAANGDQYLREAYLRTRAADPHAALIYNDYSIEADNKKSDAVYAMLSSFLSSGVPVQGVGFQSHLETLPTGSSLRANFQRFNDLGLDLHITELDLRVPVDANGFATPADLITQGDRYFDYAGAALGYSRLKVFQTWGVYDGASWVPGFYAGFGQALLFDFDFNRKPAYWGLWNALAGQGEKLDVLATSSGDTTTVLTNTTALLSANAARRLQAGAANDFMTLGFQVPFPGQWNVKLGVMKMAAGGIFQPAFAPPGSTTFTNVGGTRDTYAAANTAGVFDLGTVTFSSPGEWLLKTAVTGKSGSASDFDIALDYIRLTPVACTPVISSVQDQSIAINTALPPRLVIAEDDFAQGSLTLTATSSNSTLLPNTAISLEGESPYYTLAATPAVDQVGTSTITLTADDGTTTSTETFVLTVTGSAVQGWRQQHFGSAANTGPAADTSDHDGDGTANLLEYATNMTPTASDPLPQTATQSGPNLEYTYRKNKAATDVTFTVEWSDDFTTWSTVGVSSAVLSDNGTTQQIKATMPAGANGRRFVRLRVTR
jgi:endo-1,4-beta-xylanase